MSVLEDLELNLVGAQDLVAMGMSPEFANMFITIDQNLTVIAKALDALEVRVEALEP